MANKIKYEIPEDARHTPCRKCKALIYWVRTKTGKWMPVDPDGTPHWATCPNAKDFKKGVKKLNKASDPPQNPLF